MEKVVRELRKGNPLFSVSNFTIGLPYLLAVKRAWTITPEKLREVQDKSLRKLVKNAYERVPLYHRKYREAGVCPEDIKGIEDLPKLPTITKDDLRDASPYDIVPQGFFKRKWVMPMSTSGSTGRPLMIWWDLHAGCSQLVSMLRQYKMHDPPCGVRRGDCNANLVDFEGYNLERVWKDWGMESGAGFILRLLGYRFLAIDFRNDPHDTIRQLEESNVRILCSYPGVLRRLAQLKNDGFGERLKLKYVTSGGETLDEYTRRYIEKAFDVPLWDLYAGTEIGLVAIQCGKGNYHIQSDYIYLECLDDEGEQVKPGKPGYVTITRFDSWNSTPIIRYTGSNDVAILADPSKKCDCGMRLPLMERIEGRKVDSITLSDGKVFHGFSFTTILEKVMKKLGRDTIDQYQIIQHEVDNIDVLVVMRNGKEDEQALVELQKAYQEFVGPEVEINVSVVEGIPKGPRLTSPTPVVVSKVAQKL
jgi:phenylacetate-CoA ligase